MRGKEISSGDHVMWRKGARRATGWVLRKATCQFGLAGQLFDASPKAPRVLIRCDKDGKLTVLTPGDLNRLPN